VADTRPGVKPGRGRVAWRTIPRYLSPSPAPSLSDLATVLSPDYIGAVIADPRALADLEARLARSASAQMTVAQAFAWYEGALAEVRALRPDFDADWLDDLAPDLAIARAVNGLPPA